MKKLTINDLEKQHTKVLLDLFRSLKAYESLRVHPFHELKEGELPKEIIPEEDHLSVGRVNFAGSWWDGSDVTVADIRKILSTREHIPNKVESRAARIQRKKAGSRRGRGDK